MENIKNITVSLRPARVFTAPGTNTFLLFSFLLLINLLFGYQCLKKHDKQKIKRSLTYVIN